MGFIGALTKAGVAKKLLDEARKPENQRRAKAMAKKVMDKRRAHKARKAA